jgi:hypothetical protein
MTTMQVREALDTPSIATAGWFSGHASPPGQYRPRRVSLPSPRRHRPIWRKSTMQQDSTIVPIDQKLP